MMSVLALSQFGSVVGSVALPTVTDKVMVGPVSATSTSEMHTPPLVVAEHVVVGVNLAVVAAAAPANATEVRSSVPMVAANKSSRAVPPVLRMVPFRPTPDRSFGMYIGRSGNHAGA